MLGPDSDLRPRPLEQEVTKPRWVPLDPTLFPQGSVGNTLLTEEASLLGGRLRPETTFNQTLGQLQGIPVGDVLRLPEGDLQRLPKAQRVREKLRAYIKSLALTPHAKLLQAVLREKQEPLPPHLEPEFIQAVEKQIATLQPRQKLVLNYRFGLYDGIKRTQEEVGKLPQLNLSNSSIAHIEKKALSALREPSRSRQLRGLLPFPQGSLGRQLL